MSRVDDMYSDMFRAMKKYIIDAGFKYLKESTHGLVVIIKHLKKINS